MKLWLIAQEHNCNYDTYDSAVVAAETEDEAVRVQVGDTGPYGSWAEPEYVTAVYLGEAAEGTSAGLILGSFNAG
jgi:hypothetical protein